MARRGRRGSLSPTTYFPSTGDQLQITEAGLLWECAKSNTATTPRGDKVRYALLLGLLADDDEVIVMAIHDQDDRVWLEEVDVIHRRLPGGTDDAIRLRSYDWNKSTKTWQQQLQDA